MSEHKELAAEVAELRREMIETRHEILLALNRISAEIVTLKLLLPPRLVAGRDYKEQAS